MSTTVTEPVARLSTLPSRHDWGVLADRLGSAVFAGLVTGFLVGGVGGRLAMLLLRLTSSDTLRGIDTDDGFEIGQLSAGMVFLLAVTTVLGAAMAVGYLVVRRWLPERLRPLQAAAFLGLVGGASIIHPDGVDFTFLDPLWLAIVLFVALPAAFGWAMASLVERRLTGHHGLRKANVAALIVFGVVGLPILVPVVVGVLAVPVVLIGRRWPGIGATLRTPAVTWAVRLVLVAAAGLSLVALTNDVSEIL